MDQPALSTAILWLETTFEPRDARCIQIYLTSKIKQLLEVLIWLEITCDTHTTPTAFEYESDRRNIEHYLISSDNKAWKKIQACTGFEPR